MDREKIIEGMEMCISPVECSPDDCPYYIRPNNESGFCWDRLMTDALALLKEHETANLYKCQNCGTWVSAENVVRCKDCKHWKKSTGHCPYNSIFTVDDWFCADGERREDDD